MVVLHIHILQLDCSEREEVEVIAVGELSRRVVERGGGGAANWRTLVGSSCRVMKDELIQQDNG
jgi:hypothetical protein